MMRPQEPEPTTQPVREHYENPCHPNHRELACNWVYSSLDMWSEHPSIIRHSNFTDADTQSH
jgi:hypothetical protein